MTVSSLPAEQGKKMRSMTTTSWKRATPGIDSTIGAPNAAGVRKNSVRSDPQRAERV